MNRRKGFLPKLKALFCSPYLIAFAVPFLLCIVICIGKGIYPFGDNCILDMDMYHQYCPYFMEFRDRLSQGGSFSYDWNLGLGADFMSSYVYYLASPVNWLLILCSSGAVIEFMTVCTWIRIGLCGTAFFAYLNGHYHLRGEDGSYHRNSVVPALVFAVTYAMSGFVAAYYWNVMWMDCVILAPLIILGLERLVNGKRATLYFWTLSFAILTNYYISYMICLFLVFYFMILFVEQKQERLEMTLRFVLYSLLAGGVGMFFIIPEAAVLANNGAYGISLPNALKWYFNLLAEMSRFCAGAGGYKGAAGWPNIYSGVFMILLLFVYLLNGRIEKKNKIPRMLLLGFLFLSFSNNYLDFIWHGLHFPRTLPARQSFLFIFLLLVMGYEAVRNWEAVSAKQIGISALGAVGIVYAGLMFGDDKIMGAYAFFLTEAFLVIYLLLMLADKRFPEKKRFWIRAGAVVLVIGELTANMAIGAFSLTSRSAYTGKRKDYAVLLDYAAKEQDGHFYRVEEWERKTKNDGMLYGYPSASFFSSLVNVNVGSFYQNFGMEGGINSYCYDGATPLVSAMLSVQYLLIDSAAEESPLRKIVAQSGDSYLYENQYCLPLGFSVGEAPVDEMTTDLSDRIGNINRMPAAFGVEGNLLDASGLAVTTEKGKTSFSVSEDGYYYAMRNPSSSNLLLEMTSGGRIKKFFRTDHLYLLDLGYCKAGETVEILNGNQEEIDMVPYLLNQKVLDEAYEKLSEQTMQITAFKDTGIRGKANMKEPGRMVFTVPAEKGWHLYVDGKETECDAFFGAFLSAHLDEGEHDIALVYRTPKLLPAAIISIVSLVVYLLLATVGRAFYKRKKDRKK